jgi:hypothetical protein
MFGCLLATCSFGQWAALRRKLEGQGGIDGAIGVILRHFKSPKRVFEIGHFAY